MKKSIIIIALLAALLCLSACGDVAGEKVVVTVPPTEQTTPVPTATPEPVKYIVKSGDAWGEYGYVHFICETAGTYSFTAVDSDGIDWKVYLLAAEFDDAERFIPQVYQCALEGNGTLEVAQGQYIYIYSTANNWTGIEARDGALMECELIG